MAVAGQVSQPFLPDRTADHGRDFPDRAGAKSFIGTYGGFSYLAPLCGVNTIALYSRRAFFTYHMDFAQQMFDTVGGGSLTVVDAATRPLMRHLAPGAAESIPREPR